MSFVAATIVLLLAFVAYLTKGYGRNGKVALLVGLGIFVVFSSIEVGLGLITGDGVNDSVFFHIRTGLGGGDVTQYLPHLGAALVVVAAAALGAFKFHHHLKGGGLAPSKVWDLSVGALVGASIVFHPVTLSTLSYLFRFSFAQQHTQGFHFPNARAGQGQTKNRVMVYLEGLERTYFDDRLFPGLTSELKKLESQATTYTDVGQTIGTGFTIGGMVASQCGAPLILSGGENSMQVNRFLAGATCLSDILADHGYEQRFVGGASLEFAGKGAF